METEDGPLLHVQVGPLVFPLVHHESDRLGRGCSRRRIGSWLTPGTEVEECLCFFPAFAAVHTWVMLVVVLPS